MCLSTVYKNTLTPETIILKNVMRIECKDGMVILTDLMERQVAIEGTLEMANLVDGIAIIKENIPAYFPPRAVFARGFSCFWPNFTRILGNTNYSPLQEGIFCATMDKISAKVIKCTKNICWFSWFPWFR